MLISPRRDSEAKFLCGAERFPLPATILDDKSFYFYYDLKNKKE